MSFAPEEAVTALPRDEAGITPDWLTLALRPSGILSGGRVTAVRTTRIGAEQSFTGGNLFRLSLDYTGGTGPATMVAKLSPSDPALAAILGPANRREVAFYGSIGRSFGRRFGRRFGDPAVLPIPRCHLAIHDPDGPASLILMEDLGHLRHVAFLDGCTETDARQVVTALARLHATHWNAPLLPRPVADPVMSFAACWARYPAAASAILNGAAMPTALMDLGDHIARHEPAILNALHRTGPATLVHCDLHADNILFGSPTDPEPVILLDWQMSGSGIGIHDLGYFLISSLSIPERRRIEADMIALYHAELQALGITDYALDQCREDYLWSILGKFRLSVIATVLLDQSTPHKRAWRRADLERLIAFFHDHTPTQAMLASL